MIKQSNQQREPQNHTVETVWYIGADKIHVQQMSKSGEFASKHRKVAGWWYKSEKIKEKEEKSHMHACFIHILEI